MPPSSTSFCVGHHSLWAVLYFFFLWFKFLGNFRFLPPETYLAKQVHHCFLMSAITVRSIAFPALAPPIPLPHTHWCRYDGQRKANSALFANHPSHTRIPPPAQFQCLLRRFYLFLRYQICKIFNIFGIFRDVFTQKLKYNLVQENMCRISLTVIFIFPSSGGC